jgi:hypothetical protein
VEPDAGCGGRLIPAVLEQATGPVWRPVLQVVLFPAWPEVSRPELPEPLHPELQHPELLVASPELSKRAALSPEPLQRVAWWEQVSAQRRLAQARAHRRVAASHRERRAQPEVRSADAVERAQWKARRPEVWRSMVPVLLLERAAVVPGVLRAAAEAQLWARAQPSELPQVAEVEVQPLARRQAEEAVQP